MFFLNIIPQVGRTKSFIKKLFLFFLIFNIYHVFPQNYDNVYYQINFSNKVIGKKIVNGDTLLILEKKAGSKYVDSLKLSALDKKLDYFFKLPDSLPDGKYSGYYNDKKQNLIFIVNYKNNKRNGSYKFLHYNQRTRHIGFYNNNCFDKIRVEYNDKGNVMAIYNYSNCQSNGPAITFYATGEFFNITNYKNDKKDGSFIQYKYDDKKFPKIMYDFEYKDGERIIK